MPCRLSHLLQIPSLTHRDVNIFVHFKRCLCILSSILSGRSSPQTSTKLHYYHPLKSFLKTFISTEFLQNLAAGCYFKGSQSRKKIFSLSSCALTSILCPYVTFIFYLIYKILVSESIFPFSL